METVPPFVHSINRMRRICRCTRNEGETGEDRDEAPISAQHKEKAQEARLSGQDEDARGSRRPAGSSSQGTEPTGSVRGSVPGRSAGIHTPAATNVRRGPMRASFRAAPGAARVHLAVPRSVGTAVVRNRIRRRIRETLRELTRSEAVVLPGGEYRLRVSTPLDNVSASELRTMMSELLGSLRC